MKNNTTPDISVIVLTYKTPFMILKRCLKSIQEQTFKNIEIILLDANLKSSSYKEAIQSEAELLENIIYLEIPETSEYINGKNTALSKCSGKYVTFLSAQDVMPPKRLEKVLNTFQEENEYDVIYTDMKIQQKNILEDTKEHTIIQEFQYLSQLIIRRDCFDKMGCFDSALIAHCDEEMWFRMNYLLQIHHLSSEETTISLNPDFYKKNNIHQAAIGYRQIFVKYADYFKANKKQRKAFYKKIAEKYKESGAISRYLQFYIKALFIGNQQKQKKATFVPMGKSQKVTFQELLTIIKKKKALHFILIEKNSKPTLKMAKKLVCNIQTCKKAQKRKIADIAANTLNNTNLNDYIKQLKGNCLLIENAGALTQERIDELLSFMSKNKSIAVILAMKRTEAKLLFFQNPDLERAFDYTIDDNNMPN